MTDTATSPAMARSNQKPVPTGERVMVLSDALFRVFFAHGGGATPRPASMDVARANSPRTSQSTTLKRPSEGQQPRPLSVRGARVLSSVGLRSSCDDGGKNLVGAPEARLVSDADGDQEGFGFLFGDLSGCLKLLGGHLSDVVGMHRVETYELGKPFEGGVFHSGGEGIGGGVADGGCHCLVGLVALIGDGERLTHCVTTRKRNLARCAKFFSPLNVDVEARGE